MRIEIRSNKRGADGRPVRKVAHVSFFDAFQSTSTLKTIRDYRRAVRAANTQINTTVSDPSPVANNAETRPDASSTLVDEAPDPTPTTDPVQNTIEMDATTETMSNAAESNHEQFEPANANVSIWTAEMDEQLVDLKGKQQSWKHIAAAIGMNTAGVKRRWKQIGGVSKQGSKATKSKDKKPDESNAHAEEASMEEQGDNQTGENSGPDKGHKVETSDSGAQANTPQIQTRIIYCAVPGFTAEELRLLDRLYRRYEGNCLRASSRFFDKTGRRISMEEVRQICGHYWMEE